MGSKLLISGEKMKDFLSKYGKHIIIAILSLTLGLDKTVDIAEKIKGNDVNVVEAGEIAIAEALRPVITEVVKAEISGIQVSIEEIKEDITEINDYTVKTITNNAIAAYSKIYTIQDLEDSPLKKVSIMDGLLLPSCYEILFAMDMERTKLFYEYLVGDQPQT